MKKRSFIYRLLAVCFILVAAAARPASEKAFPELIGKTLDGKSVILPRDIEGKYSLIGIAYSHKAQDDLNTWIKPVSESLVGNVMFPVNLFFVPMTGDIKLMSQEKIEARIKESLDQSYYKYVILYQGETKPYKEALGMTEKDKPYFLVVNPKGQVTYMTSGKYSDAKLEALTDHLSE